LAQLAHLHLLLNHFPTIGFSIGLGLFIVALWGKYEDLKRASLGIILLISLISVPIYMTGKAAQEAITGQPGVSEVLIERHQDAALLALIFMQIVGALAWIALWQYRRMSRPASWSISSTLVFSILTFALMARTANIGGEIRHPEILAAQDAAVADTELVQSASIATWISSTAWAWPALESLHFIGLCLLFGAVLVVNLRMLGLMKNISFSALHLILPWGILGFAINLVSGVLFFITVPAQYTQNVALHWKMVLMMIGGINVLYFTLFEEAWVMGPGDDAPMTGKIVAASTIFIWFGVILMGRMMPFMGGSF
jgi:hypothetical protein